MDLDLLDGLPPPTISLTSNRSWSMTKFIDFPEDVLSGEDDHHRSQVDSSYLPGEPRYLSVAPISRGILIHDSGEYVQPQDVWASSFSNRFGSADSPYYHISTDSFSNAGTTPSPASTTGNMFLSSDAHLGTEDSGPSSMTSPNSDGSDSSGHSVYSVSTSERHNASLPGLSVPSFSPSLPAQPGSHSPLSIYSSISSPPLVLSATSSPSHAPYPLLPDRMPSPLQLAPQDAGTTVNMSDVYSHPSTFDDHAHDIYALTLGHSFSDFDEHRSQTYSSPLNPSILLEADVESEFGYHSPFRTIDSELEPAIGKRGRMSEDFTDDMADRKRARQNSPVAVAKKRGRPRKSEQVLVTPSQAVAYPPTALVDSDDEYQGCYEDESDSDIYVPSDEEDAHRKRGKGRKGSGGNAEALKELEMRTAGEHEIIDPDAFDYSEFAASVDSQESSMLLRQQRGRRSQPVPVPNLTKKSRGRKVPVSREEVETPLDSAVYHPFDFGSLPEGRLPKGRPAKTYPQDAPIYGQPEHLPTGVGPNEPFKVVSGGIKKLSGERRYVCTVDGCGKCFVRGEHLKRHVRSLHTWEKPHICPHPGCGKSFSRRDNLGQHVRVHF